MKALLWSMGFLFACRTAADVDRASVCPPEMDGGSPVAAAAESPLAPPLPGERAVRISSGTFAGDALVPPPAIVGRLPSEAHPLGTLFVSTSRGESDLHDSTPYVFEWDVHHEAIIHRWTTMRGPGALASAFPSIAFDGTNLFVLTHWDENHTENDEEPREMCWLDVLDDTMQTLRSRRVPCANDVVVGRAGRFVLRSLLPLPDGKGDGAAMKMRLQLFDRAHRVRGMAELVTPPRAPGEPEDPVQHAGDSFFVTTTAADGTLRVVRFDDTRLLELGRSPSLGPARSDSPDGAAALVSHLARRDDGWSVNRPGARWQLSPDLTNAEKHPEELDLAGPEVWLGNYRLGRSYTAISASIDDRCAPIGVHNTPVFVCSDAGQLAIVRPSLEDLPTLAK